MNPRFALAWKKRENNPELVQDSNDPRTRPAHEREAAEKEAIKASKPPGKQVSIRAVFETAGWQRKNRKNKERRSRSTGSGRKRKGLILSASKYPSGTRSAISQGRVRPGRVQPDPYINLYNKYKEKKEHMEDEGFWDAHKSAEDQFGFTKDEQELAGISEEEEEIKTGPEDSGGDTEDKGHTSSDSDGLPKELKTKKPGKRVVISSMPPASTIIPDSDDTGIDTNSTSRSSSRAEIVMDGNWRKTEPELDADEKSSKKTKALKSGSDAVSGGQDVESSRTSSAQGRGLTKSPSNPDLMSRFYARLQELREAKQDDDQTTTTTDAITRSKDRKRIKTALRRLLADRLFPEDSKSKRSKPAAGRQSQALQSVDDGITSGTITPLTLGSRSKTNLSTIRADGSTRATTRMGSQGPGRVVFVSEHSELAPAEGTDKLPPAGHVEPLTNGEQPELQQEEPVAYYRRHPLGTLKHGQVSRLYQPPAGPQRAKTSLSQTSIRQGLRTDKAFLQRLKGDQGIRAETRWSVPGEYPPGKGPDDQSQPGDNSKWRREQVDVAWSYNMPSREAPTGDQDADGDPGRRYGRLNYRDLDDYHLRKLLEELYKDKKYMDKIIETTEKGDDEEEEVSLRMENGREYLLQRAYYWLEKGPLPPRPPTTELGYKLEKLRAKTSSQTGSQSPLPKQTPLPPGRGNSTMSSSTIRTTATAHTTIRPNNADLKENGETEKPADSQDNASKDNSPQQESEVGSNNESSAKKDNSDNNKVDDKSALNEPSNNDQNQSQHASQNHVSHSPSQPKDTAADDEEDQISGNSDSDNDRVVNVYSSAESRTY